MSISTKRGDGGQTGLAGGIMALGWAIFGGFTNDLLRGSGELMFGWRGRGTVAHPELVLSNPKARKMPYAVAAWK